MHQPYPMDLAITQGTRVPYPFPHSWTSFRTILFLLPYVGSCVWLMAATLLRMPVSATHSIVGATVGFALVAMGTAGINWKKLFMISEYLFELYYKTLCHKYFGLSIPAGKGCHFSVTGFCCRSPGS